MILMRWKRVKVTLFVSRKHFNFKVQHYHLVTGCKSQAYIQSTAFNYLREYRDTSVLTMPVLYLPNLPRPITHTWVELAKYIMQCIPLHKASPSLLHYVGRRVWNPKVGMVKRIKLLRQETVYNFCSHTGLQPPCWFHKGCHNVSPTQTLPFRDSRPDFVHTEACVRHLTH